METLDKATLEYIVKMLNDYNETKSYQDEVIGVMTSIEMIEELINKQ